MPLPTTTMDKVVAARSRDGWAGAIQPTFLLQAPIWWGPRLATRHATARRMFTMRENGYPSNWVAETVNPLPIPPEEKCRDSPHGLLRTSDLDVLMALSYHYTQTGRPLIEVEQRTILTWMGYSRMDEAPYRELRASLQRMASTTIAVHDTQDTIKDYVPSRLVSLHELREGGGPGTRGMITASLADEWVFSLTKGFTIVDMHAYAHLCRSNRELGLARVVYLFLTSVRKDNGFDIPLSWVAERFRDIKGTTGQALFADPLDSRSKLYQACNFLMESGVVELDPVASGGGREPRFIGRFARPDQVPRIPDPEPEQRTIWRVDRLEGGMALAPRLDAPDAPAPEKTDTPIGGEGAHAVAQTPDQPTAPTDRRTARKLLLTESLSGLCRFLHLAPRTVRRALGRGGWSDPATVRLLLTTAWRHGHGEIHRPAGYVCKLLADGDPSDPQWATTNIEAQDWAFSPSGPLHHLATLRNQVQAVTDEVDSPMEVALVKPQAPQPTMAETTSHSRVAVVAALEALDIAITDDRVQSVLLAVHGDGSPKAIAAAARGLASFWREQDAHRQG